MRLPVLKGKLKVNSGVMICCSSSSGHENVTYLVNKNDDGGEDDIRNRRTFNKFLKNINHFSMNCEYIERYYPGKLYDISQ